MIRQIVVDTETTGLDPGAGHRIVEIACIELIGRKVGTQRFHSYINPQRPIDAGAMQVHGITDERVADEPVFAAIAKELIDFIRGAELIIHNAAFDKGFLDAEFKLLGQEPVDVLCSSMVDTLKLAREARPGKRNSLDALCRDYGIDNSNRQLHGALLDAELLAEVYLAMTRSQDSLLIELDAPRAPTHPARPRSGPETPLQVLRASAEEIALHEQALEQIQKESQGKCVWLGAAPAADAG